MTGFNNQEGDSFKFGENEGLKLVSLESGITNTAKRAYSSYVKDDTEKEEVKEEVQEVKEEPKQEVKKTKNPTKNLSQSKTQKVTKTLRQEDIPKSKKDSGPTVMEKLEELKDSIEILWANIENTTTALFYKLGSLIMKPLVKIYSIFAKILEIPLRIANKFISSFATKVGVEAKKIEPKKDIEEEVEEVKIKTATFSDMIELNIIFSDNYKNNLYNKNANPGFKLSKMEEELIMNMAIEAIKECAEFTIELPPPTEGIYRDAPIHRVMEEVTNEDVYIFLGFVKGFPGKYIGKTWKISETFATWLINNSPTG